MDHWVDAGGGVEGWGDPEAVKLGTACAVANVGTLVWAGVRGEEVERLKGEVGVEE